MQHVWGSVNVFTRFGWENLRERGHLEDSGIDARIILRCNFRSGVWEHGLD
jgi:hypothetical protein